MNITGTIVISGPMNHIAPPQPPAEPSINTITYSTVNTGNSNISVNVILTLRSDGGYPVSRYTIPIPQMSLF
jgi:hypothetical protein